ncbi:MAG: hypothetical protein IT205_10500 [Fimbriimonadaceae bacterium]|nr:hypothetical protein [Fimbriimonadaceae bacterium]
MPLTNASLLSENRRTRFIVENSPIKLQIARVWPWLGVDGSGNMYARKNAQLTPTPVNTGCSNVAETADTLASITFPVVDFVVRKQICFTDADRYHLPNNPDEDEYLVALAELIYGYFAWLDGTPGTGGLRDYIAAARIVDMGGGALTFPCLNLAYNFVVSNNGRPTVIVSSSRELRTYEQLCRDNGFAPPQMPWQWYNPSLGRMEESLVTQFNGTPWLINGCMAGEASPKPSNQRIYFMVLGDDGGEGTTRGVTGIVPQHLISWPFVKRVTNGTHTFDVGQTLPVRDMWVSFPSGLAIGSQGAISMIQNFEPLVEDCNGAELAMEAGATSAKSKSKRSK